MSVKMMSLVWEYSEQRGSNRLVLLALADSANDEGICWPGLEKLAKKCRLGERYVRRIVAELEAAGEVERVERPGHSNLYKVGGNYGSSPTVSGGNQDSSHPGTIVPPTPEPEVRSGVNNRPPISVRETKEETSAEPGSSFFTSDDWQIVKGELKGAMTKATYDNLIAHTEFAGLEYSDGTPIVLVRPRNAHEVDWLNQRLKSAITPVLLEYCQMPVAFKAELEEVAA